MKTKQYLLFVWLFLLLWARLSAQTTASLGSFDPPHFVNLSEKNGLVAKTAIAITQDKQGYTWVGTNEGLTRYDGQTCKNFVHRSDDTTSLASNSFNALACDSEGWVWCATLGGLDAYLPDKQQFRHFLKNLKGKYVKCLLPQNDDWIWVGTMNRDNFAGGGLQLLNKKTGACGYWQISDYFLQKDEKFRFKHNSVTTITKDENNPNWLWVATEAGVALFDIRQFRFIHYWAVPTMDLAQYQFVTSLLSEKDGSLWVGCWGLGLYHFDPKKESWTSIDILKKVKNPYKIVSVLQRKSDHELWVGSGFGVILLDKNTLETTLWEHDYRDAESMLGYLTWAIFEDAKGIIWFGLEGGVSRWDKRQDLARYFYPNPRGKLNPNVFTLTSVSEDAQRSLFYLTLDCSENLYLIDYQTNKCEIISYFPWKDRTKEPRFFQTAMTDSNANLWLYSQGELFLMRAGTKKIERYTAFDTQLKTLGKVAFRYFHEDAKGNFWLTGQEDIVCLNVNALFFTHFNFKNANLPNIKSSDYLTNIVTDTDGNAYIGSSSGLIVVANQSRLEHYPLTKENADEHLNLVRSVALNTDGSLWLSIANQGVVHCFLKENKLIIKKTATGNDFYLTQNPFSLLQQKDILWLQTQRGLLASQPTTQQQWLFDDNQGLRGNKKLILDNPQAFQSYPSGKITFATEGGKLAWFEPSAALQQQDEPPIMRFEDVKIFDTSLVLTPRLDFQEALNLTYKENFFSVAFAAVHFSNHQDITYAYRLDGLNTDWVQTATPLATYTNIKGGNYVFRIKAKNINGLWSEERRLSIHIEPPFWEKGWFLWLVFLSVLTAFYLFYQYRINQLNEKTHFEKLALKSELKALRAQMNPHFMFNVLNTIKGIVLNNKPLDAAEHLSDFSYLLRQSLQQSREPLISLKDDLETVQLYVRLERLRFAEKFDFECLIHDDVPLDDIQLPPMLLQPYIENAIVHAFNGLKEKGKLLLEIKLDGDSVCCIIDDNGIGRTKKSTQASTKKHQSLGMKITNERIEMQNQLNDLGLEVQILDKKNAEGKAEGTRVVLRIPII